MNERIRQLAEQSGVGWDDKYHWFVGNEQMKQFAELIVEECANFADQHNQSKLYEDYDLGVGKAIKKHFGVEE